jgi:cell filamentation protein, protein adenylyltransferase
MQIQPVKPEKLPLKGLPWEKFVDLLGKAHLVLGRFEELTCSVPDPQAVFALLLKQEALDSLHSQHLGISLQEALELETLSLAPKQIKNYERAIKFANSRLSLRAVEEIHATMNQGSKKLKKDIGHFRTRQNWIGPEGCKMTQAYFLPPKYTQVRSSMRNLVHYAHSREKDPLVQIAIFFAQLLVIHPFMDGNGRVGRLLISLLLYKKKIVSHPFFFLSGYLKEHRLAYFQKLYALRADDDWEGWIRFFLIGIIEQGELNCARAKKLAATYLKLRNVLSELVSDEESKKIARYLFLHPIFKDDGELRESILRHLKRRGMLKCKIIKNEKRWFAPPLLRSMYVHKRA